MQLAQWHRPLGALALGICRGCIPSALQSIPTRLAPASLAVTNAIVEGRRHASVRQQGAYRLKNNKGVPKKLGAKRIGDQYVIPGHMIYKQRGRKWHPGEGVTIGRDHSIHAAVAGYVKYYTDPYRYPPGRRYIGVALEKHHVLPRPPTAPRPRRLDMVAVPVFNDAEKKTASLPNTAETPTSSDSTTSTSPPTGPGPAPLHEQLHPSGVPRAVLQTNPLDAPGAPPRLLLANRGDVKSGAGARLAYAYREETWRLGRMVDLRMETVLGGRKTRRALMQLRRREALERRADRRRDRATADELARREGGQAAAAAEGSGEGKLEKKQKGKKEKKAKVPA